MWFKQFLLIINQPTKRTKNRLARNFLIKQSICHNYLNFILCPQLECISCGNSWYASRDDAATLTIEGPSSGKTVAGTAPLTTAKFEDIEKTLVSPVGAEEGASDASKKTTEAVVPVLEKQQSFNKTRVEERLVTNKAK